MDLTVIITSSWIWGDAQATVARYPVCAQVMDYHNPDNPKESALER